MVRKWRKKIKDYTSFVNTDYWEGQSVRREGM